MTVSSVEVERDALPTLAVCKTKFQKGIDCLPTADEPMPEQFELFYFDLAFRTAHETDAHFATYAPVLSDGSPWEGSWPRLRNKGPVVAQLREQGIEVVATVLVVDYDNPPGGGRSHGPWTPELWAAFEWRLLGMAAPL